MREGYWDDANRLICIVSNCHSALENFLCSKYFPKDSMPSLTKVANNVPAKDAKYKGIAVPDIPSTVLKIIQNLRDLRGQHKESQGRNPTRDQLERLTGYPSGYTMVESPNSRERLIST